MKKILYYIIKGTLHAVCLITHRVKKIGEENVPKEGGYVICSNHRSNWDGVFIVACTNRKMGFLAKEELYKSFFFRILANTFDIYPVKRDKKDIESVKWSLRRLKDGKALGLFPEGTRNGLDKNEKVKDGAVYLAMKAGVPIIPVGIKADNFKLFSKVYLVYGKPIVIPKIEKAEEKKMLSEKTEELMNNIIELTK